MIDFIVVFEREMMMSVVCNLEEKKRKAVVLSWLHAQEEGRGDGWHRRFGYHEYELIYILYLFIDSLYCYGEV